MIFTKEIIIKQFNDGKKLNIIAFWRNEKTKEITKSCLSQWYDCYFYINDVQYHTVEQYMMAQKAILFNDLNIYSKIMSAKTPKEYKSLGRKVHNFDSMIWNLSKFEIVLNGNIAKFSQNPELFKFLDGTHESILVEGSPYDCVWGVKLHADDPRIYNPNNWRGENLLGFALMEVRDILRKQFNNRIKYIKGE